MSNGQARLWKIRLHAFDDKNRPTTIAATSAHHNLLHPITGKISFGEAKYALAKFSSLKVFGDLEEKMERKSKKIKKDTVRECYIWTRLSRASIKEILNEMFGMDTTSSVRLVSMPKYSGEAIQIP